MYRNRLLMRQAVSLNAKARSVFDASYAENTFVSMGRKPFAKHVALGDHPQVYAQDVLTHSMSWHSQLLSLDAGSGCVLTWDIKKMDKSVLHSTADC